MECSRVYIIEDRCGNILDARVEETSQTIDGMPVLRFIVDTEKSIFTDDDIYLIMGLLHKALDKGGSYSTMKDCVGLLDKLNEQDCSK